MNFVVFDVPAEHSGALTILREFFSEIKINNHSTIHWCMVVSTPRFAPEPNIKVRRYPWVKKSWLHRLYFELFITKKILKEERADLVFSMQNTYVRNIGVPQVLYLHQSIPFSDLAVSLLKSPLIWINKHVLSYLIIWSLKQADHVIVQTKWIKDAAIKKTGLRESKFMIISPTLNVALSAKFKDSVKVRRTFFYPAGQALYKNHEVIIKAIKLLILQEVTDFEVILTWNEQTAKASRLQFEGLPIQLAGMLSHEQVMKMYTRSVLIFPSLLETFGLPLLEARECDGLIIASNTPFANEILEGYENAVFFDPHDSNQLANQMRRVLSGDMKHNPVAGPTIKKSAGLTGWGRVIDLLIDTANKEPMNL